MAREEHGNAIDTLVPYQVPSEIVEPNTYPHDHVERDEASHYATLQYSPSQNITMQREVIRNTPPLWDEAALHPVSPAEVAPLPRELATNNNMVPQRAEPTFAKDVEKMTVPTSANLAIPKVYDERFFLNKNIDPAKTPWYVENFPTFFAALNELPAIHFIFLLPLLLEKYTLIFFTFINDFLLEYSISNQFTACTLFLIYAISFASAMGYLCSIKETLVASENEPKKSETKKKKKIETSATTTKSSSSSSSDTFDVSSWFPFGSSTEEKGSDDGTLKDKKPSSTSKKSKTTKNASE